MVFYVYELRDPDTLTPFYVGKGSGVRMYIHERAVRNWTDPFMKTYNPHLYNKIKKILDAGKRVIPQKVFETDDEEVAFEKERVLIEAYRKSGLILCNVLDGGEGYRGGTHTLSEEAKKKIGDALRGKPKSEEHREALRQAKYKNPVRAWKDKKFSEEHKQKLREAKQQALQNPEYLAFLQSSGERMKARSRKDYVVDGEVVHLTKRELREKLGVSEYMLKQYLQLGKVQEVENAKSCEADNGDWGRKP